MKVEKKNWILLGLVALLCFTGFLNYKFNERSRLLPRKAAMTPRPGSRHSLPLPKQETLPRPMPMR